MKTPQLTIGPVMRTLKLSRTRVTQLDHELKPQRGPLGIRLYDPRRVDEVAARRRTAAEERSRGRLRVLLAGCRAAERGVSR